MSALPDICLSGCHFKRHRSRSLRKVGVLFMATSAFPQHVNLCSLFFSVLCQSLSSHGLDRLILSSFNNRYKFLLPFLRIMSGTSPQKDAQKAVAEKNMSRDGHELKNSSLGFRVNQ